MSGQATKKKKTSEKTESTLRGVRPSDAPSALRLSIEAGGLSMTASEGFPAALRPLCDPALLFADYFQDAGAEAVQAATFLRSYWIGGDPVVLAVRAHRSREGDLGATALALSGVLFETAGPGVVAALPALLDQVEKSLGSADLAAIVSTLKPETRPKTRAVAEAAAARLLTGLGEGWDQGTGERCPPALVEAGDEAVFWRGVGALIGLLPARIGCGVSAVWTAETKALRPGAAMFLPATSLAAPAQGAPKLAAEIFAALDAGSLAPPRFAAKGGAALSSGLDAALLARLSGKLAASGPAEAMRGYASNPEAPAPEPAGAAEILLTAGAAAEVLRAGAVGNTPLAPFGAARCVGWIAGRADAALFWPALESRGRALARWRALSLAEPAEQGAVTTLGALADLDWAEEQAREAAPEGMATPFDAPVVVERLAQAVTAAADLLIEDPLALADPALRLERLGKALKNIDPKVLARPIDALELCADAPPRECLGPELSALARGARMLRKHSGLSAMGRYDRPPVPIDHAQAALFFGASWLHCLDARAWRGAAFWRDRFFAWLEMQAAERPDAVDDALTGLRRLAERMGPAGAHVMAEPALAGGAQSAVRPEPVASPPKKQMPTTSPQEPRAHLSPDALQEAMAALRKGAEEQEEGGDAPTGDVDAPQPAKRSRAAKSSAVDDDKLAQASALISEFREDFAAEVGRRAEGGDHQALELSFPDKKGFAAIIDAAATLALERPGEATEIFGDRIAWALRQLSGLGRKPAARPLLEPAPDSARRVWAGLASGLDAPGEDADFLSFASKLLAAEKKRRLAANLATDGLVSALQGASVTRMIGSDSISFTKTTLRDFLYQGRRGELKGGFEALDDADIASRMDRALFFFCLLDCTEEEGAEGGKALIEPRRISPDGAEIRTLTPTDVALSRFGTYLSEGRAPSEAHGAGFDAVMQKRGLVHNASLAQLWRRAPRRP